MTVVLAETRPEPGHSAPGHPERPDRVAVVGSGYIAVELTGIFAALGAKATLVLRGHKALKDFDSMLGEATVKTHINSLLSKLGVTDRTQAATTALQRGIVHLD